MLPNSTKTEVVSIPAMGGNRRAAAVSSAAFHINPRNGGAIAWNRTSLAMRLISIPAMGGNRVTCCSIFKEVNINPRDGGQ